MYADGREEYTGFVKLFVRIAIILFGLLSIFAFYMSLSLVRDLSLQGSSVESAKPEYHFALYLPENRDSFFSDIIRGAEKAASESGAVLTIHSIDPSLNELEFASYTGVDGILVCPYLDDKTARDQLEKIRARKIPLVLINHNVTSDQPWSFIGANNFEVGRRMGSIVARLSNEKIELAVVYSDKAPGISGERELVEMGISEALQERLASPITGLRTGRNPLDAEAMIYSLFRSTPRFNTIIFTDSNDTIAAAQALVDMNLVGRVQLVGFGNDPSIREYIRKGIIAASIAINPEKIGYEAIISLSELRESGYTSNTVDSGVEVIDGSGL